jgi:hypothetical protein
MTRQTPRSPVVTPRAALHGAAVVLVAIAAGVGAFSSPGDSPISFLTVRGEHATYAGGGIYRFDPIAVAREGRIWDTVNLLLGVPLLSVLLIACRSPSPRIRVLRAGLFLYFAYVYLMYATMSAFNPLYLVYVGAFNANLLAFILELVGLNRRALAGSITGAFPRRTFAAFAFFQAAALLVLWLGRIVPMLVAGRFPDELAGMTTLETQALDLGVVVPLAIATGVTLLKRSDWGYVLLGLDLVFGLMMYVTIPAWILVPLVGERRIDWLEATPLLLVCLLGPVLLWTYLRAMKPPAVRRS